MTKGQTSVNEASLSKKVSIQERSVLVGDIIFVNGHGVEPHLAQTAFC